MDTETFLSLLREEVATYKNFLETTDNKWIVKGFIDVDKNIYTISNDTKVVSKIIEILLIPKLNVFAKRNGLILELPSKQNYYPDLTFKDGGGRLFAVDFKSSYYEGNKANALTLGSYWGYFRNRSERMNTDYPYGAYQCHLVVGLLYKQANVPAGEKNVYSLDEIDAINSVIENFVFFVQPKWKIALDRPGSGNTRNIGSVDDIEKLVAGTGPFADLGEDVFDDYWMNYFNNADARTSGPGTPNYKNLKTYKAYKTNKALLNKLK